MKNTFKYITILSLGLVACEPQFDEPIEDAVAEEQSSGDADFSTFVALGDSLTAGFADGALYMDGQNNSFANMLATQMQVAGGGDFNTPLMDDNFGGFAGQAEAFPVRFVLDAVNLAPVRANVEATSVLGETLTGTFNNIGIPGAKSFHLFGDTYGDPAGLAVVPATANPYYVRMAPSATTSPLMAALSQAPTFFTLWIGANDVLGYATAGGDPTNGAFITDEATFSTVYNGMVGALAGPVEAGGAGAKGLLVNIPPVTSLPFFTTVPNNALVLDAEQAASLTGFFQAYSAIFAGGVIQQLLAAGLDLETASTTANTLASQYAITFSEGANRFLIKDESDPDNNPQGFRQMTSDELLLLTIDQTALATQGYGGVAITDEVLAVLGKLQAGGTPTAEEGALVLGAVNPILDADVLDTTEQAEIATATEIYNTIITTAAETFDLALYDAASRVEDLADDGISVNGSLVTNAFATGGFFSLDGIHLSPKGNGITANEMIDTINEKYGSTLEKVQTRDLPGVYID